jgi:2-polyprenyl-6-methoxyphenol hydroxylase-like FAD-dependent oxidoreductase
MKTTSVVIAGGGFAGLSAAMHLDKTLARRAEIEVTFVSQENFILFTPMLHEVAAGDLYPGDCPARDPRAGVFLSMTEEAMSITNRLRFDHSTVRFRFERTGQECARTTIIANNKRRHGKVRVRDVRFSEISGFERLRNK